MTPRYVVVIESEGFSSARGDFDFSDDVQAIVGARRVFLQALMEGDSRPVSLTLGRHGEDGAIDWLNSWKAA